ncbi:MAG: ROK family protein [Methylococcales bacterium]|jgi:fructokinase|nr:ROK family protein [Methylococcales bacterium]MBT7443712.1 ROK family protein [Methylococcales bacterium]
MSVRIGIDLGGTKIELIALDESGQQLTRFRQDTPQGDYHTTLNTITNMVLDAEQSLSTSTTVGIATPGALSPATGKLRNANSTCLNGQPILQDLQQRLDRDIRIANDADCFTLSEAIDGAAVNANSVFGVIIGTGTGGGLVINKTLLQGPNAITGEWGHNPLPWQTEQDGNPRACYCGKTNCIETYLSGIGLSNTHKSLHQQHINAKQIHQLATTGNAPAEQTLQAYEDQFARAIASIINVFDPEMVVLGGGLSNMTRLINNTPERLQAYLFSDTVLTQFAQAQHGDSSGVRGAAWLWPKQ